ncbi:PREDICTED: proline-rich protein 2-like [Condylura cristata]|uniref:proline-rich protein 2-like n=1 Tax=Condylura cristata TaxID=143302 RepID=UPI000642B203|nr:PREDICTED: proline-rich protein 2-like [Condylura cristata]
MADVEPCSAPRPLARDPAGGRPQHTASRAAAWSPALAARPRGRSGQPPPGAQEQAHKPPPSGTERPAGCHRRGRCTRAPQAPGGSAPAPAPQPASTWTQAGASPRPGPGAVSNAFKRPVRGAAGDGARAERPCGSSHRTPGSRASSGHSAPKALVSLTAGLEGRWTTRARQHSADRSERALALRPAPLLEPTERNREKPAASRG